MSTSNCQKTIPLLKFPLKSWIGKSLLDLQIRASYGLNVIAMKSEEGININVSPNALIEETDILVVIGHNDDIKRIEGTV